MAQSGKRPKSSPRSPSASKPTPKAAASSSGTITFGSRAEQVAYYLLHALVFLVPIAISNFAWTGLFPLPFSFDQFDLAKVVVQRVFTIAALAAWAWAMLSKGGKFKRTHFYWLILALLAWIFVSSLLSIHVPTAIFGKYRRLEGFLSFVNYAVVFFLAVQLIDKPAKMRSIVRTLFFSNMVVVGYGLLQAIGADPIQWGQLPFQERQAFATYGNPDLLGGFLMFTVPTSLGLAVSEDRVVWRFVYWIGFLVTMTVLVLSFVRGAWVGAFVSLAIMVFAIVWLRDKLHVVDWSFVGVTIAAVVGLATYSSLRGQGVMNFWARLSSIVEFNQGSAKTRFEIWSSAVRAIAQRPVFGFGPDTFRLVFPKYKPAAYTADAGYLSVADNVHNYPLQLTAGIGIPGSLMLYGLVGWELVATARHAFDREAGYRRILYTSVWAAVIGYIVLLMTGLSVTGTSVFMWLFLGLLAVPLAKTVEFNAPSWGSMAAVAVVLVAIVAGGYWMWWASADYYYLLGRIGPLSGEQRIQALEEAIRRNPFNDMYRAELPLRYGESFVAYVQQAQQEQQQGKDPSATLQAAKNQFDIAESKLLDTIDFVPWEYDNYVFLANLYNQAGTLLGDATYFEKAIEIGKKGIAVEPFGPAIKLQTAIAYASTSRPEQAAQLLAEAIKLDPAFRDPRMLLGEVYARSGQYAKAVQVYRAALETFPDDPQIKTALEAVESKISTAAPKPKK